MSQPVPDVAPDAVRRLRALLAAAVALATGAIGGLLVHSAALGLGAEAPTSTTLVVLLVSLTGLALAGSRHGTLAVATSSVVPHGRGHVPPVPGHRVTDPLAHPRRPRAPGTR